MIEVILYIAVGLTLIWLVVLLARRDVRREINRQRFPETEKLPEKEISPEEKATRNLLGDDVYDNMVKRVDAVLSRHSGDRSVSIPLTMGPDSLAGEEELHRLLPGDPLWLRKANYDGMDIVEVFSGGFRIGRLLTSDAMRALQVMDNDTVTGSYVSEQNSWGDCDTSFLRLVLFYRPVRSRLALLTDEIRAHSSGMMLNPENFNVKPCEN